MKKLLLLFFAVFFAAAGFAQPFSLTPDGFRDCKDTTKDYIVVQVPDTDKAALFQRAKNYFTLIYNSPQKVMSESGTDAISILGAEDVRISLGGIAGRRTGRFSYKLLCEFRDGRVKITPQWVDFLVQGHSMPIQSPIGLGAGGCIYRKNGEVRDEEAKSQIEDVIFSIVDGLEKALNEASTNAASEDW